MKNKYDPKAPRPNRRLRPYESLYRNLLHRQISIK